jgi:hypothetical protein
MADNNGLSIRPDEVNDVSRQLDGLADRLSNVMKTEAPNLTVTAPGHDEVSQRVAGTLNDVHAAFTTSADKGVTDLQEAAATLRAHSNNIAAADEDFIR